MNNQLKALLILGFLLLAVGGFDLIDGYADVMVTMGLILLALGIRVSEFLKGFTYTVLILASVSMVMFYPQYFL